MSNAEIIGSTNLIILLEDEIFADFFNTFLSLPVFGQIPFYNVENSQWSLWPEIPHDLIAKYKGLLTWLEKYRLPFFCKTNLCFQYILCQELISFVKSPEGAKMMRWRKADQWLLQKCIGGVRGMRRFCAYLKGSPGEELLDFWILVEKILSIDEMNLELRDHYLSLLLLLKATHLQEGSKVVTLCNMNIKSLLNLSTWHPTQLTTRREILSHMQKVALFKLQSYCLPNFYTHAKVNMAKEEECQGLMQEYESRLCSICCAHIGGLPLNMSIKECPYPPKRYSSRKSKKKMWQLIDQGSWSLEMDLPSSLPERDTITIPRQEMCPQEKVVKQMQDLHVAHSKEKMLSPLEENVCSCKPCTKMKAKSQFHAESLFETKLSSHLKTATPIINHFSQIKLKKVIKPSLSLGYTHWALSADTYAGSPFRNHLKKQNLKVETQLLDLWQDLQHFLNVLMSNSKSGNAVFRYMLGYRICELYLNEQMGPCLPLKSQTIQGLKKLLPLGDANPWISRAQKEICKILSPLYEEFLKEEDYWFLIFTTQNRYVNVKSHKKGDTMSKEENILLCKRVQESLKLSQELANMEEMDSLQWQKIVTENMMRGGSLHVELASPVFLTDVTKMSFKELCFKNPKMAIQKISDDYRQYCERTSGVDFKVEIVKQSKIASTTSRILSLRKLNVKKPSARPRNLTEVLLNVQHQDYFKEFLKERKADSPLQFLLAIQKISVETNEKLYKSLLGNVMKTFFHGKVPAEELLQCKAPIVKEIAHMRKVSTTTLLTIQDSVMKSLEEKWFKEYQDLFTLNPLEGEAEEQTPIRKPSRITTYLQESQRKGWLKMISFIKSFCKYRRCIVDPVKRQEFEDYLHMEMYSKENFTAPPPAPARPGTVASSARSADHEDGEIILMKRRILGHRIITVNFLINDIYFFSEMEKFNDLVSSSQVLQTSWTRNENDLILMKSKMNIIQRLYLQSEVPPKLRVNISDSQKEAILAAAMEGHLDRNIFHGSIMSLFPVIMHFWKRWQMMVPWVLVTREQLADIFPCKANCDIEITMPFRFCIWKETRSYFKYMGKKLKDRKIPPKPPFKYPPWSGGDHAVLRFSLLRGIEWYRPQQREVTASPGDQNSTSKDICPSILSVSN